VANTICCLQVLIFFFIQAMFAAGLLVEVWHVYEKMKSSGTVFELLL
jgi:pentatricopeptide repeat protein